MKRFFLSTIALGVAALLLSGCHHDTPPPKPKPPKVVKVKPVKTRPEKPIKTAKPGTPSYMDAKNGFRDLTFGTPVGNLPNLVQVEDDPAHQLKTYVRTNEDLSLIKVPLQKIEYTFFDDRLCQVTLYWNLEYPSNSQRRPSTTELSGYCTTLYGRPVRNRILKDNTFYVWRGQKTGVMLTENLMPGVPNLATGSGWSIPPATTGQMVIYSDPLRRTAALLVAKQGDGL